MTLFFFEKTSGANQKYEFEQVPDEPSGAAL
jgi:hypothetical protein